MAWLVWIMTAVLVAATAIPLSRVPHGFVRGLSFARQQVIQLSLLTGAAAALSGAWIALACLVAIVAWQVVYIARFLPTGRVQSLPAPADLRADSGRHLRILTANVKMSNRAYGRFIALARAEAADVVILLEPDRAWLSAMRPLHDLYPYRTELPLDTGYGMALFARRPLGDVEWRELLVTGVPSLKLTVRVGGEKVRLYVLHPEPPVPFHDTKGRDAEIGLVGIEVASDPLPAIVAGDLNDVAWSHTTRRFQRLSGQLDPRVGRGFYNTFHAQNPLWRCPLDHLFHDARFRLVEMRRLPAFGSDHFAMLFGLALDTTAAAGIAPEAARADDHADIQAMAAEERLRDRAPIGEDWEKRA